jgi:hypothetical protein
LTFIQAHIAVGADAPLTPSLIHIWVSAPFLKKILEGNNDDNNRKRKSGYSLSGKMQNNKENN